jgi:hypothetical protein
MSMAGFGVVDALASLGCTVGRAGPDIAGHPDSPLGPLISAAGGARFWRSPGRALRTRLVGDPHPAWSLAR